MGIKYKYRSTPTKATNPCKKSMILKVLTITVTILASFHTIYDSCPLYSIAAQANLPQGRPLPLLPVERLQPGFGNGCQVIKSVANIKVGRFEQNLAFMSNTKVQWTIRALTSSWGAPQGQDLGARFMPLSVSTRAFKCVIILSRLEKIL